MKHIVHCRYCGEAFDRDELIAGVDWVQPYHNWYFHKKCYDEFHNLKVNDKGTDEIWHKCIYDLIINNISKNYHYWKCEAQIKSLLKQGRTYKGIYFALLYFYKIKRGNWEKGHGGIGIVSYIYDDAVKYWIREENKRKRIEEDLKLALTNHQFNPEGSSVIKEKERPSGLISLDFLDEEE